jgi:spore maturation protein CgeB
MYDTAAAAGFLLVGRVPEQYTLENVFDPNTELETFGSITELQRKIRHYLAHPEERAAIAQRAAARARREHAMDRRMEQVVRLLTEDSDDR